MTDEEKVEIEDIEAEEHNPTIEERIASLEDKIARVLEAVAQMNEHYEKVEEEIVEEVEADETAQLHERINALEEERDRAVWTQTSPAALKWTPELAELLFSAWRGDKEKVSATLGEATIQAETAPAATSEPAPVNPFAVRLSEPSGQPEERPTSDEDLSAEALRIAEGDQRKALTIYRKLKAQTLN